MSWRVFKETLWKWFSDNVFSHAAALAFYALSSLAPVLIIAIAMAGTFFGEEAARGNIFMQIRSVVGDEASLTIEKAIQSAAVGRRGLWATLLGFVLLLAGATSVFAQLKSSLNAIWKVKAAPTSSDVLNFLKDRLLALVMVLGMGIMLLASLIGSSLISAFTDYIHRYMDISPGLLEIANASLFTAMIALLFAMVFKILPDVLLRWRDVWVGALVTAILFSLGKYLIAFYISHNSLANVYGAAGSLVVILLWIYYSSLILFLGATFTQVYTVQRGHVVVPAKNSVWAKG